MLRRLPYLHHHALQRSHVVPCLASLGAQRNGRDGREDSDSVREMHVRGCGLDVNPTDRSRFSRWDGVTCVLLGTYVLLLPLTYALTRC